MSFLSDTAKWTKWYSKHAWNPWWLIKEHALSDNAFRDYQAETGGSIKGAKMARNTGRVVAAILGAYYGAAALGAGGAGGAGGATGGATGGGGEAALAGLGGVGPISYSGFTASQGGIGSLGSGWGNAGVVAGEGGSGAAGTAGTSSIPWKEYVRIAQNAQSLANSFDSKQQYQYNEADSSVPQYTIEDPADMGTIVSSLRERIDTLKQRLGEQ